MNSGEIIPLAMGAIRISSRMKRFIIVRNVHRTIFALNVIVFEDILETMPSRNIVKRNLSFNSIVFAIRASVLYREVLPHFAASVILICVVLVREMVRWNITMLWKR